MNIQKIIPTAKRILEQYSFCDACLGRLFSKKLNLKSNKKLGQKIKLQSNYEDDKCFICKNLMDNLKPYLELMLEKSSDYQYSTFVVGAILKPSIIDRDDFIRSKFKLKGIDSIKTDLTHELSNYFKRKTRKIIDPLDPELTLTVNTKDKSCEVRSKYLIFSSRYSKFKRGMPQKQKRCSNCNGKGCMECNMHGITSFDSVEGVFSKFLFEKFGGTFAKFTWIGGEDKNSLVYEPGRLFFVKLQNPNNRRIRIPSKIKQNSLLFTQTKIISDLPKQPVQFHSLIEMDITTNDALDPSNLKALKKLPKSTVIVYENSGKRSEKSVYSLKYKKIAKNNLRIFIDVDGGLPIKRFVDDSNVVPNLETLLNDKCKCKFFDFHKICLQ
ncbi:MAG: pseudouridine synthase [Nitrosopumilaceae archaeon]|nr:pseudouridine synthase [Nitrosopumilaceae archaeon]